MISRINWPAGFEPANSPIHAANEIEINAAPDLGWRRLIEAPRRPEYYPHASEIHLQAGEDALRSGIQFTWVTAEKKLVTTVKEYVPTSGSPGRRFWRMTRALPPITPGHHPDRRRVPCTDRGDAAGPVLGGIGEEDARWPPPLPPGMGREARGGRRDRRRQD